MKRKRIKVCDKKSAIAFLSNVISVWTEYNSSHSNFCKAIKILLKGEEENGKK